MLKNLQRIIRKKQYRNFCISSNDIKKQKYQFFEKTLAFSVNNPHFPHNAIEFNIPNDMKPYLDEYITQIKYATIVFPRFSNTNPNSINDFFQVGQYCTLEKLSENSIGLQSIHRVDLKNLMIDNMLTEKQEILNQMKQNLDIDFNQTIINEDDIVDDDEEQQFLNRSNFYLKLEDHQIKNILYSHQDIFPLLNFDQLSLEDRVKVDNLIQYTKNLDPRFNINRSFLINYNDIEQFLDEIAYQAWKTGIFRSHEIIPLYAEKDFSKKIDLSIQFIKKLSLISNQLKQIVEEAERNIQRKKQYEVQNEIVKIIKNQAKSDEVSQIDRIQMQFDKKDAPENIKVIFNENMKRLLELDRNHPEYNITLNYLKWVSCLPYGQFSEENFDLQQARKILDEDHEGLDDVKKRILEFLAVGKLKKSVKGKILCLKGPPGVGKTSFAFSIGKVLNKKVFRISLGGENDVSVLKGHRKTYIGSRPGKIVDALKQTQQENCVLIIDEIDKTAQASAFGDPQSTLLEILDPEQNNQFMDNYLDFPIDLSNVFFICTANDLSTIQQPLLDRMDIIEIHSYTNKEKREIFKNHLLPKAIENTGLLKYCNVFEIKPEIIDTMINGYCREAGIRSLQKNTNKLLEKIAYKILEQTEEIENSDEKLNIEKIIISNDNLEDYLGNKIFEDEQLYQQLQPGVVQGLAYSGHGGALLYIESSLSSNKQKNCGLKLTGNLGDVMKESMKIAYSFTRKFLKQKNNEFLNENQIHIHVPEGATPKDGPSAGITLTTSLISLALKKPLPKNFAMTGEISLKGKVMKIGGLKEKLIAANREGVTDIILPFDNKETAEDLSDDIKKNLKFHFVENYKQVYEILFINQFKVQIQQ